jgi:hypothetical protein
VVVIVAVLSLLGIGLVLAGAAALERIAGDRLVVEMRTWAEDVTVVSGAMDPRRAA